MGVWTAGTAEYARSIVDGLIGLFDLPADAFDFVLSRGDAMWDVSIQNYIKDLDVVRAITTVKKVYLVDDNPIHSLVYSNKEWIFQVPMFIIDDTITACEDFTLLYLLNHMEMIMSKSPFLRPLAVRPDKFF